jgi:meiotically up-regulated gene 157 (Mug157) protein
MTLDATVKHFGKNAANGREDTYLLVGNINTSIVGMWLRDSANQVAPYLYFANEELDNLGALVRGVLNRHVDSVLLDSYAHAFAWVAPDGESNRHTNDNTTCLDAEGNRINAMNRKMGVRECKFEMDSLLATLRLGRLYYNRTQDLRPFDSRWIKAIQAIVDTLKAMQQPLTVRNVTLAPYTFQRQTVEPKDTLAHGVGRPGTWTGMVRTGFLPSDDAALFPYHIPGNAMAVVELRETAALLRKVIVGGAQVNALLLDERKVGTLEEEVASLAAEIDRGVRAFGRVHHPSTGGMSHEREIACLQAPSHHDKHTPLPMHVYRPCLCSASGWLRQCILRR